MADLNFLAQKAYALTTGVSVGGRTQFNGGYCEYIKTFLSYSIGIGFALAFLMIVYAGVRYISSQGNQTITNEAKDILLGAVLGFVLLLTINLILKFFFGVNSKVCQ